MSDINDSIGLPCKIDVLDLVFSSREGKEESAMQLSESKEVVDFIKQKISHLIGCVLYDTLKWEEDKIKFYLNRHNSQILVTARGCANHVIERIIKDPSKDSKNTP